MSEIVILDVGHGNCAIVVDSGAVTVIDAPRGATHLVELRARGLYEIDTILVSHSDADHSGGVLSLLLDKEFKVRRVLLNPDSLKQTAGWEDLMVALRDAQSRSGTRLETSLTTTTLGVDENHVELALEVLAPHPTLVAKGPGSTHKGRSITSNTASAVIRIKHDDAPVALFTGDMDWTSLSDILDAGLDLTSPILVFPHHGGTPGGGDAEQFAETLCRAVRARSVIFSIGRSKGGTPRPEIIAGVRKALGTARIACTQLASSCAPKAPSTEPTHLTACGARGKLDGATCAGSLVISIDSTGAMLLPSQHDHEQFITASAPSALCRRTFI